MDNLFNEFENVTAGQWKAKLEKDLKGITFQDLSQTDANNIQIHPFYTLEDLSHQPANVFQHTDWSIMQHLIVDDEQAAHKTALQQLNDGVSGITFQLQKDTVDLDLLLSDIQLPYITVVFEGTEHVAGFGNQLNTYLKTHYPEQNTHTIFINSNASHTTEGTISINGLAFNNRGSNSTTELAAISSHLNEQLHQLDTAGTLHTLKQVYVSTATDTLFYHQIAKLRALRILIQNILDTYQIKPQVFIHGATSHIYRSPVDMHSNMLRDTIAAMAAIAGGANAVTVFPYDYAVNTPSSFSNRMAKNIQLILREESFMSHIADVSAGSYFIESLTKSFIDQSWKLFLQWEAQGGWHQIQSQLENLIQEQAQTLVNEYKEGKKILIGVNKYPNSMETNTPPFRAEWTPDNYLNIAQALS